LRNVCSCDSMELARKTPCSHINCIINSVVCECFQHSVPCTSGRSTSSEIATSNCPLLVSQQFFRHHHLQLFSRKRVHVHVKRKQCKTYQPVLSRHVQNVALLGNCYSVNALLLHVRVHFSKHMQGSVQPILMFKRQALTARAARLS
jgi:hypothetical protein